MATAAPASPSSNVSAAEQPIDGEQTKAQGGSDDGGVGGEPGEIAPKRQKKERLPGVMTKDDGEGIFDDLGYKNRAGKRVSRKEAQADADREMREELGIVEPPEADKPKEEAPAPKKFKFGGKEFDSQEAAEQSHKSLEGMFKPLNERVSKAEQVARDNADSARQWRERAMAYEAGQLQAPQPQQQVQQQPTTPQSAEQELQAVLSNVDGEMFETLARERGLPLAGRYLAAQVLASVHDQMLPALRESIMAEIMPQLQPMQQSAEFQQATDSVTNLFENVSQLRNPDGQTAFPELNDENEAWEVAELWSSMDNPTDTPQSLIQAIALYRLYRGARGGQQQSAPAVQVSQPRQTAQPTQTLEQGGSSAGVTAPRAGMQTEQNRFARALDDVDLVDRTLGFAVRRRR